MKQQEADLPPKGEALYSWPKDMSKPHNIAIILLVVPESVRMERISKRKLEDITVEEENLKFQSHFRANVLEAYRRIEGIIEIDASESAEVVVQAILSRVEQMVPQS
jgi:thymidylate kinase